MEIMMINMKRIMGIMMFKMKRIMEIMMIMKRKKTWKKKHEKLKSDNSS